MSRWWREQIRIAIHADRIDLVRLSRGLRPQITQQESVSTTLNAPSTSQVLFDQLSATLRHTAWRGARVSVVLSHHWCRLALIPAGIPLRTRGEELRYARARIEEGNGEAVDDWELRLSNEYSDDARVACAVEKTFLDGLGHAIGRRLVSVQPYLAAAYSVRRLYLGDERVVMMTIEPRRVCIAQVDHGEFRSLRTRRLFSQNVTDEIARLLDQERLLTEGEVPAKVVLCSALGNENRFAANGGWQVHSVPLPLFDQLAAGLTPGMAMALEGIR